MLENLNNNSLVITEDALQRPWPNAVIGACKQYFRELDEADVASASMPQDAQLIVEVDDFVLYASLCGICMQLDDRSSMFDQSSAASLVPQLMQIKASACAKMVEETRSYLDSLNAEIASEIYATGGTEIYWNWRNKSNSNNEGDAPSNSYDPAQMPYENERRKLDELDRKFATEMRLPQLNDQERRYLEENQIEMDWFEDSHCTHEAIYFLSDYIKSRPDLLVVTETEYEKIIKHRYNTAKTKAERLQDSIVASQENHVYYKSSYGTIEEPQRKLIVGMRSYIKGMDTPPYSLADVDLCEKLLKTFVNALDDPSLQNDIEHILPHVKELVVQLNALNDQCDGELIETDQREHICAIVSLAIAKRGHLIDKDYTYEWRDW